MKFVHGTSLSIVLACLLLAGMPRVAAQPGDVLVIRGGTLIDGTGRPPVANAVVVIAGNRIQAVGPGTSVSVPAGARTIDATGKTVLPGLIDAHGHYREFEPELLITHGVTTFMDTGNYMDYVLAVRDATAAGKLWGPRIFTTGSGITGADGGVSRDRMVVRTIDEARAAAREHVRRGVDFIKVYDGITVETLQGVTEEAHKAGIKVVGHLRLTDAYEAVNAGIDGLIHAGGVSAATVSEAERQEIKNNRSGNPWGTPGGIVMHDGMDESRFDPLIKLLVSRHVMIDPTLVYGAKGIMPAWDQIELECRRLLSHPSLLYVPSDISDSWCTANHLRGATPEQLQKRRTGYDKMTRFLKKFADAGGAIVAGSDFVGSAIPGLTLHNEIATYVHDVGLTPMQAIMTATKNTADFYVKDKGIGTVEPGKLADVIIVRGDPLRRIEDTRNIDTVIKDGRVMDLGYHVTYWNPYVRPMASNEAPLPRVSAVRPYVVTQGETGTVIKITGADFPPSSVVWAGQQPLKTTVASRTELSATLCDDCTGSVGPLEVRVSPSLSGVKSNSVVLLVVHRVNKTS